jgi:hypothetical protein
MLGLLKAALALRRGSCFASAGCEPLTRAFDFDAAGFRPAVHDLPLDCEEAIAGVSSFGIGGTNAHVVLAGLRDRARSAAAFRPYLFLVGSHRAVLLDRQRDAVLALLDSLQGAVAPCDLAYTCRQLFSEERARSLVFYDPRSGRRYVWSEPDRVVLLTMPGREKVGGETILERLLPTSRVPGMECEDVLLDSGDTETSLRALAQTAGPEASREDAEVSFSELVEQLCIAFSARDPPHLEPAGTVVHGLRKVFSDRAYIL